MKIEHIALWTNDLEKIKDFYCDFFSGISNEKYMNPNTGFQSYFITFESGARLEVMQKADYSENKNDQKLTGLAHFAFSAGSKEKVDHLTELLRNKGVWIASEPRTTGDGYYESVVLDPDKNRIEITI